MITRFWFNPPLAIARIGSSTQPLENFSWGEKDTSPRGTGKTTILPELTLSLSEEGVISEEKANKSVTFKDSEGFRPVCPFFELHADWTERNDGDSTKLTPAVLREQGLLVEDLKWNITVANHKAYHYTLDCGDKVEASVVFGGNKTTPHELYGKSPVQSRNPIVPESEYISLGFVQASKPMNDHEVFRIRFTPPSGKIYGPINFLQRRRPEGYDIPKENLFLNSEAAWCRFQPSEDDSRTNPGGLYAQNDLGVSLGLVDDVSDGIIKCQIAGLEAVARIVVAPPDFAPDRRPFISIADGLKDKVDRAEVWCESYYDNTDSLNLEISDLFERITETMWLMNLDAQNARALRENQRIAASEAMPPEDAIAALQNRIRVSSGDLPLTEWGRQHHRRIMSMEVLEDKFRENPELLEQLIRKPMTEEKYYNYKMPPLMRGSDRYPLHLTRRQYDLLEGWIRRLRKHIDEGS